MTRVLVAEDDVALAGNLAQFLTQEGFEIASARTLSEARRLFTSTRPEVVVLDWMLPDGQAIDWVKELRQQGNLVRIVMLTARSEVIDKVLGLESGANDYLTKPFDPRELATRIRVQSRDQAKVPGRLIRGSGISLNLETREVNYQGAIVPMTRMEFELLRVLMENPGKVFSREELLNQVWGFEVFPSTRTVDTHILQLRQKLNPEAFETSRGVGYRFRETLTES